MYINSTSGLKNLIPMYLLLLPFDQGDSCSFFNSLFIWRVLFKCQNFIILLIWIFSMWHNINNLNPNLKPKLETKFKPKLKPEVSPKLENSYFSDFQLSNERQHLFKYHLKFYLNIYSNFERVSRVFIYIDLISDLKCIWEINYLINM